MIDNTAGDLAAEYAETGRIAPPAAFPASVDVADYRQRIATLTEGLDLSEDSGHEVFIAHLDEAFEATPVASLRVVARALGVVGPPMRRDDVVESIALAWGQLDPAEQVAPTHTDAEVRETLAEIVERAATVARLYGGGGYAGAVRSLRSLVDALPDE